MIRKLVHFIACISIMTVYADIDRDEVKRVFISAGQVIDNPSLSHSEYQYSLVLCNYDTNVYASIMTELALTNNNNISESAFQTLGLLGAGGDLPFLYSCATNEQYAANAVSAILKAEGCTETSVDLFNEFLMNTNISQSVRSHFGCEIFDAVWKPSVSITNRNMGVACVMNYAPTANRFFLALDEAIIFYDQTYRMSRRRLAVLRSVRDLGMNPYQHNYVTNAINELVAYPEANLPE